MPRKRAQKPDEFTVFDMFTELASGVKRQATSPNIHAYKPHPKQSKFHSSAKPVRLYIGGNRSGKTVGGIVEDIWWAIGKHPYRRVPEPPVRGRVHTVDFVNGLEQIIMPAIKQWCPPSMLKYGSWEDSYDKVTRVLNFANGSFIEFKSYEMDLDKFAGTSRHFCHYDEEPPLHIYNESQARLVDVAGEAWLTMTPLDGMTWVFDNLFIPGTSGHEDIEVIQVDMTDNPHLNSRAVERFLSTLDDDERSAREHGRFVQLGGLVYKQFSSDLHVVEPWIPPKNWEHYASVDHGFNAPTAWLWHAVSPTGEVVTYDEHYANEMTVAEHAAVVHEKNRAHGIIPIIYPCDPALRQRQGVTGTSIQQEYADHGIYVVPSETRDVNTGINRIASYLRTNPVTDKPRYTITANCVNYIREMKHYRWDTYASKKMQYDNNPKERPHKKDDHACDSARYFFTFLPDLTPEEIASPVGVNLPSPSALGRYDEVLARMVEERGNDAWRTTEMYESMID